MEVAKTNVPASAKEMVANASKTAAEIAAQTAIPTKHIYKALFSHSIPMSSFVFNNPKPLTTYACPFFSITSPPTFKFALVTASYT